MLNRVITISREFGSGGRTIGKRVAEKLGIPLPMRVNMFTDEHVKIEVDMREFVK